MTLGNLDNGELVVEIGPMYSSKTHALAAWADTLAHADIPVLIIKWSNDSRYASVDTLASKSGVTMCTTPKSEGRAAITVVAVTSFDQIDPAIVSSHKGIGIDEGQFFSESDADIAIGWADARHLVRVVGLSGTTERKLFPGGFIPRIIPHIDNIIMKQAVCSGCRRNMAIFSTNIKLQTQVVSVGGKEAGYRAACRQCYLAGRRQWLDRKEVYATAPAPMQSTKVQRAVSDTAGAGANPLEAGTSSIAMQIPIENEFVPGVPNLNSPVCPNISDEMSASANTPYHTAARTYTLRLNTAFAELRNSRLILNKNLSAEAIAEFESILASARPKTEQENLIAATIRSIYASAQRASSGALFYFLTDTLQQGTALVTDDVRMIERLLGTGGNLELGMDVDGRFHVGINSNTFHADSKTGSAIISRGRGGATAPAKRGSSRRGSASVGPKHRGDSRGEKTTSAGSRPVMKAALYESVYRSISAAAPALSSSVTDASGVEIVTLGTVQPNGSGHTAATPYKDALIAPKTVPMKTSATALAPAPAPASVTATASASMSTPGAAVKPDVKTAANSNSHTNATAESTKKPELVAKATDKSAVKSVITLATKLETKPVPKTETKPVPKTETKPVPKTETKPVPKTETKPVPKLETKTETKPAPKLVSKPVPKPETKPVPKPETEPETKPAPKLKPETKPTAKPVMKTAVSDKKISIPTTVATTAAPKSPSKMTAQPGTQAAISEAMSMNKAAWFTAED